MSALRAPRDKRPSASGFHSIRALDRQKALRRRSGAFTATASPATHVRGAFQNPGRDGGNSLREQAKEAATS